MKNPHNIAKFLPPFVNAINQSLPNLDEKTISLAIKSNLGHHHTDVNDASSRFLFILTSRYHNYKPVTQLDRGAESPDKSWFGIARRNADSMGCDARMVDELYRIAGENNW